MNTKHAVIRAQQRGIPPLIATWLLTYGEEQHDGHGAIYRFFSKKSIRRMERDFGREPLRRLSEYRGCYLVEAGDSGKIITIGHRFAHIRRI
jgi:hypothetical protein